MVKNKNKLFTCNVSYRKYNEKNENLFMYLCISPGKFYYGWNRAKS